MKARQADWSPKDPTADFRGNIFELGRDGWLKTTTTYNDGRSSTDSKNYRVSGNTLIVNKGDYLVNFKFMLKGDEVAVDNSKVRALLKRI